jgi:hypothetical protein
VPIDTSTGNFVGEESVRANAEGKPAEKDF